MFKTYRFNLSLLAALIVVFGLTGTAEAQTGPGQGWCTQYVAAKLGLPATYPNAKDWGNWLPGRCFRRVAIPQFGGPIVFQPGAHGVTDARGHVGIVYRCQSVQGGLRVTVRGANQGGKTFTDIFSNVSDIVFFIPNGDRYVSFWTR